MNPAEIYERRFVPALFGPWGTRLAARAEVGPGHRCLDVACGTGALTRALVARNAASVVGLDASTEMIAVAKAVVPGASFVEGEATALPFDDDSFDRVVSQFGLMFVADPGHAVAEMARVRRPGGRLLVATCAAVERSPAYAVLTEVLHRLFGPTVAEAFRAPFALGTEADLVAVARTAALSSFEVTPIEGRVTFASIRDLVETERACAWTLGGQLDEAQFTALQEAADIALRPFVGADGLQFTMPAIVLMA